jgi:hypothetical protein
VRSYLCHRCRAATVGANNAPTERSDDIINHRLRGIGGEDAVAFIDAIASLRGPDGKLRNTFLGDIKRLLGLILGNRKRITRQMRQSQRWPAMTSEEANAIVAARNGDNWEATIDSLFSGYEIP